MSRRGFTLVELAVASLIGIIALIVTFNAILLLTKGEKSADRDASKALTDARLMQSLLQDLRSSFEVDPPNPTSDFTIRRYNTPPGGSGPLVEQKVDWKVINDPKNPRITRQVQGESRVDEFSYKGLLDPNKNQNLSASTPLAIKLRLEKVSNVRFPP